jgi:Opioid growth factor receptor (OGFr) conserved region
MSRLVVFFRGDGTDAEGRLLEDVLAWPDDDLEAVHDFIQWLFPLPEPSQFNPDAPLLTNEDIAAFKSDPVLQANLMKSFERILAFLGLSLPEGKVVEGPNFKARVADVWSIPNHNWLRISRILRSLTLLGLADQSQALYEWLEMTYTSRKFPISAETFWYWTAAVKK